MLSAIVAEAVFAASSRRCSGTGYRTQRRVQALCVSTATFVRAEAAAGRLRRCSCSIYAKRKVARLGYISTDSDALRA